MNGAIRGAGIALSAVVLMVMSGVVATAEGSNDPMHQLSRSQLSGGSSQSGADDDGSFTITTRGNSGPDAKGREPGRVLSASQGYVIECKVSLDEPHYSTGAAGAIGKIRVKCQSTASVIVASTVDISCAIGFSAKSNVGPWTVRASDHYSQQVSTGFNSYGAETTYYCPRVGSSGGTGTGWWKLAAQGAITSPGQYTSLGTGSKTSGYKTI